jgi:hypothetical protein
VFENRVPRKVFGTKKEEVTGDLRKLYKEHLCGLLFFSSVKWVIKLKSTRWAGNACRVLVEKQEGTRCR